MGNEDIPNIRKRIYLLEPWNDEQETDWSIGYSHI